MLHCFQARPSSAALNLHSAPSPLHIPSPENTPGSSAQPSPTVNLTREYALAVQSSSYNEIWTKFHRNSSYQEIDTEQLDSNEDPQLLANILQPNRECVEEALGYVRPSTLIRLASDYFDHSENSSHLCLELHQSVSQARSLYAPLHDLLNVFPLDYESLTQSQCDRAFDVFLQFDRLENPFPCPNSHSFNDMRRCFSELKQQLDCHICKSHSRVSRLRRTTVGCAICLVGTVASVVITAVAIASHSLIAFVSVPFLPALLPSKMTKKELAHLAQLEAAAKGTYFLQNDLDTVDRLVTRLHATVEGDKFLIQLGLERGRDKHTIQDVVEQLRKNHDNSMQQLADLEEHLCLCFTAINRARSFLLREISLHETRSS